MYKNNVRYFQGFMSTWLVSSENVLENMINVVASVTEGRFALQKIFMSVLVLSYALNMSSLLRVWEFQNLRLIPGPKTQAICISYVFRSDI